MPTASGEKAALIVQCGHHLRWTSKKAFTRIFGVIAAVNRDVMSQTYWLS